MNVKQVSQEIQRRLPLKIGIDDMANKSIKLEDGKYIVHHNNGRVLVDRYEDDDWRDCTGDGLILALIHKIEELQEFQDRVMDRNNNLNQNIE